MTPCCVCARLEVGTLMVIGDDRCACIECAVRLRSKTGIYPIKNLRIVRPEGRAMTSAEEGRAAFFKDFLLWLKHRDPRFSDVLVSEVGS